MSKHIFFRVSFRLFMETLCFLLFTGLFYLPLSVLVYRDNYKSLDVNAWSFEENPCIF